LPPSVDGINLNAGDAVYRRAGDRLEFARLPIDTVREGKLILSGNVVSGDEVSPAALSGAHEWKVGEVVLLSARKAPVVYPGLVESVDRNRLVIQAWNPLRKAREVIRFDLVDLSQHAHLTEPVPARDDWQDDLKARLVKLLRTSPMTQPPLPAPPAAGKATGSGASCTGGCAAPLDACCKGTPTRDCLARNQPCKRAYFACRDKCSAEGNQ
jgi:hypothetical protein